MNTDITALKSTQSVSIDSVDSCEFKAPWLVVAMGFASVACLYLVGTGVLGKIRADMDGHLSDESGVFFSAVLLGVLAECLGAGYLYRGRRSRKRSKLGAMFVIALMLMMLLPIQFAVVSIWVSYKG